jgi:hypothetical protein
MVSLSLLVYAPPCDGDSCFFKDVKGISIQAFILDRFIEGLVVAFLSGATGLDKQSLGANLL